MKLLIGIIGEKGSGKETAGALIRRFISPSSVALFRSSDLLKDTLNLWSLPLSRHNLQYLAICMNKQFGDESLSFGVRERIKKSRADILILDGVRWKSDEKLVRSFSPNLLLYVTAKPRIRFLRLKRRNEKAGEGSMSFAQFLKEEKAATETEIASIGSRADRRIVNDGDMNVLRKSVRIFVETDVLSVINRSRGRKK